MDTPLLYLEGRSRTNWDCLASCMTVSEYLNPIWHEYALLLQFHNRPPRNWFVGSDKYLNPSGRRILDYVQEVTKILTYMVEKSAMSTWEIVNMYVHK